MSNMFANILFFPFNKSTGKTNKVKKVYKSHATDTERKNILKAAKRREKIGPFSVEEKDEHYWRLDDSDKLFIYIDEIDNMIKDEGWKSKKCFRASKYIYDKYVTYIKGDRYKTWKSYYEYWSAPYCIEKLDKFKNTIPEEYIFKYYDEKEFKTGDILSSMHKEKQK